MDWLTVTPQEIVGIIGSTALIYILHGDITPDAALLHDVRAS